jgi:hypothetical protein
MWRCALGELIRNPFVRFWQAKSTGIWKIYWRRQTDTWELYAPAPTAKNLTVVLAIANADDPFDPLAKENGNFLPLYRGHKMFISYEGLSHSGRRFTLRLDISVFLFGL